MSEDGKESYLRYRCKTFLPRRTTGWCVRVTPLIPLGTREYVACPRLYPLYNEDDKSFPIHIFCLFEMTRGYMSYSGSGIVRVGYTQES